MFTTARGREAVFWQSARTRKQARPNVRTPTARAAGIAELEIVVDSHEQYPYRFTGQQVRTVRRALPCGDYGLIAGGWLVAAVERKSMADLVTSLTGGKLRYALAEEWTYRYLAAAHTWAAGEDAAVTRIGPTVTDLERAPAAPDPSTAEIRAWAREHGHVVPDRGRLRPEIIGAWHAAHPSTPA